MEEQMGILLTESEAAAAGSGTSMIVMLLVYAVLIGAMWFFFYETAEEGTEESSCNAVQRAMQLVRDASGRVRCDPYREHVRRYPIRRGKYGNRLHRNAYHLQA